MKSEVDHVSNSHTINGKIYLSCEEHSRDEHNPSTGAKKPG
jgi:hypothetical protein